MADNPYLKRVAARNIGDAGRASEKRVAKSLKAQLTPASGALAAHKGDAKLQRQGQKFLVECKSTKGDTLKLDLGWLMKIQSEALAKGSKPVLTISFVHEDGRLRGLKESWVCIPQSTFDELTGE